jgi:hypothetical protein
MLLAQPGFHPKSAGISSSEIQIIYKLLERGESPSAAKKKG